jgi:hypothetical protein
MQAKKVFEVQNFERGQNPKASMDLGGIVLEKEKRKRHEALKDAKDDAEVLANQEWEMYLQETLVGKKITAKMTSLPTMNVKTHVMTGKRETKDFTIVVEDISTNELDDNLINIVIADTEHNMYALNLDEKIYFE